MSRQDVQKRPYGGWIVWFEIDADRRVGKGLEKLGEGGLALSIRGPIPDLLYLRFSNAMGGDARHATLFAANRVGARFFGLSEISEDPSILHHVH